MFLLRKLFLYFWEKLSFLLLRKVLIIIGKKKWNWMRIYKIFEKINIKIFLLLLMKFGCYVISVKIKLYRIILRVFIVVFGRI